MSSTDSDAIVVWRLAGRLASGILALVGERVQDREVPEPRNSVRLLHRQRDEEVRALE